MRLLVGPLKLAAAAAVARSSGNGPTGQPGHVVQVQSHAVETVAPRGREVESVPLLAGRDNNSHSDAETTEGSKWQMGGSSLLVRARAVAGQHRNSPTEEFHAGQNLRQRHGSSGTSGVPTPTQTATPAPTHTQTHLVQTQTARSRRSDSAGVEGEKRVLGQDRTTNLDRTAAKRLEQKNKDWSIFPVALIVGLSTCFSACNWYWGWGCRQFSDLWRPHPSASVIPERFSISR